MELAEIIKTQALRLGFDRVGITTADPIEPQHIRAFSEWIEKGHVADLEYMRKNLKKRIAPARLLDGARSVICVAVHYKPPPTPAAGDQANIANFALYEDYHPYIKERLRRLAEFIQTILAAGVRWKYKICVDTAPLAERALAARAGLGFIGKNHMLIHPQLGAQILLGELVSTLALPPDRPLEIHPCQTCNLCLRACPVGALREDGFFEARRCISYLTQYPSDPSEWADAIGNHLFGCDRCLLACPYERRAPLRAKNEFCFYPELAHLDPLEILQWNRSEFYRHIKNSCLRDIGLEKLKKNARICAENRRQSDRNE